MQSMTAAMMKIAGTISGTMRNICSNCALTSGVMEMPGSVPTQSSAFCTLGMSRFIGLMPVT